MGKAKEESEREIWEQQKLGRNKERDRDREMYREREEGRQRGR